MIIRPDFSEKGMKIMGFCGGIPDGKRTLGRPRCKWKDNIKIDFQGVKWGHRLD
jgi:hypothetical protein